MIQPRTNDQADSKPPVVLSIAGFDPSSGAGITADLQVFAAHRLFGTSAITALTVQSTTGVRRTAPVSADLFEQMLDCLVSDLPPAGVKVGMLADASIVRVVARTLRTLREHHSFPLVLDPVLRSSSGHLLLDGEGIEALVDELLPLADCATPNREELTILAGQQSHSKGSLAAIHAFEDPAARVVAQAGLLLKNIACKGLIVTGGDADRPDDLVLEQEKEPVWLRGEPVVTTATHGTGCAFSSALLSNLVHGNDLLEAAHAAKRYVEGALRHAPGLGHGRGPLHLGWPQDATSGRNSTLPKRSPLETR